MIAGDEPVSRTFSATPIKCRRKPERLDMQNLMLKALRRRSAGVKWIPSTALNTVPLSRTPSVSKLCTLATPTITSTELGTTEDHVSVLPPSHTPKVMVVGNHRIEAERDGSEEVQGDMSLDGGACKLPASAKGTVERGVEVGLGDGE